MKRIWERIVHISKAGHSFDIGFWQAQSSNARFRATWQMLRDFYRIRKRKINAHTFRLQRSVETLRKR
ncbi:MAG: hypothetical protein ABIG31_04975 [Candidatus Omnitrophota bacterium]